MISGLLICLDTEFITIDDEFRMISNFSGEYIDQLTPHGYYSMFLYDMETGRLKAGFSHRLIWTVFNLQYIPEGLIINHIDGIKINNNPLNLELSTFSENTKHAYKIGLISADGENNNRALFTNNLVCDMRKLFATTNISLLEIAEIYEIHWRILRPILNCRNYRNVVSGYEDVCKYRFECRNHLIA